MSRPYTVWRNDKRLLIGGIVFTLPIAGMAWVLGMLWVWLLTAEAVLIAAWIEDQRVGWQHDR